MVLLMLAIDPSLNSLGYAFRHTDGTTRTGVLRPKKVRDLERLDWMDYAFGRLVDSVQPTNVVYEDYSMGSKGKTFHIGEMGGVLKVNLWRRGIDIILVPPTNLKMFATGKGNADKDLMMSVLAQHRGRSFDNSDEADAYGLLLLGEAFMDSRLLPRTRNNPQRQAMKGVTVIAGKQ